MASRNLGLLSLTIFCVLASGRAHARACLEGYWETVFGCLPRNNCPEGKADFRGTCMDASRPALTVPGRPVKMEHVNLSTWQEVMARVLNHSSSLYATGGFKDRTEWLTAARRTGGAIARAAEILMNEDVEVAMVRSSANRDEISDHGFLNFRQLPKPKNSTASTVRDRDVVEGNYLGLDETSYAQLPDNVKLKAAYLKPKPGSGLKSPRAVEIYPGDDRFIFKLDAIRDRMTVTPGDSVNRRFGGLGGHTREITEPVASWDQLMIPWAQRELIIPLLATGLEEGLLGVHMEVFMSTFAEVESFPNSVRDFIVPLTSDESAPGQQIPFTNINLNPYAGTGLFENYRPEWGNAFDYIEAQILGELTLAHVAAFEFTKVPPTGRFLAELQRRGIEIRDLRCETALGGRSP